METFNFNFECNYCISYRGRRKDILNELFNKNIANNISSYVSCAFCNDMHEYEKEYATKTLKTIEHKQIHCILTHFDNGYKKLTNLKYKKNYLKDIVEQTNCVPKPLYKKFLTETENINMIDEYRMFWLLDHNICYLFNKWDFYGVTCKYRNTYEEQISKIMISLLYHYCTRQVGLYRRYFNFDAIYEYLCDIFEEEED